MRKRRPFFFFLTLALCLGLLPAQSLPVSADDGHTHTHDGITFTAWTSADSLPTSEGNYYLTTDVTLGSMWACTANINLCLNGHGIIYTNSIDYNNPCAIMVQDNATLSVYDCGTAAEHKYTVDSNGLATVNDEAGTETFTGGYITGSGRQRGACVRGGILNLYGGTIIGSATDDKDGAGVYVGSFSTQSAVNAFNLYGGCIRNNYGEYGGGVYVDYGTFTMSGGSIENNKANENGGGVYVCSSAASFEMNGGTITGNTANHGGGVYAYAYKSGSHWYGANVKLSGGPAIEGNTANVSSDNVCLLNGLRINIGDQLTCETPIGISVAEARSSPDVWYTTTGVFTEDYFDIEATTPVEDCFTSDNDKFMVAKVPGTETGKVRLTLAEIRKVTFNANDGKAAPETKEQNVPRGIETALKANPFTRQGYYFVEWDTQPAGGGTIYADNASVTLTENATLYAQWALCSYAITWCNDDGTVLKREQAAYNVMPDYTGVAPTKAADAQYTYTFTGWTPEIVPVTGDATYTATFTAKEKEKPTPAPVSYDPAPPAPTETPFDAVDVSKGGSLENFKNTGTYTEGMFTDADENAWYMDNLKAAVELGILEGMGDGTFGVGQPLKLSETLAIACRLHNLFYGGDGKFDQSRDENWFTVYEDYAAKYGIISKGQYDLTKAATRAQFAAILAAALPDEALTPINAVTKLPDVAADDPRFPTILKLYNAGVLNGVDASGRFDPDAVIPREQVAAMATRIVDPALRKTFTLEA